MENTTIPLDEMVVKIASRCNINCTYCYMYNQKDQSYKIQPKFISRDIIQALIDNVQLNSFLAGVTKFSFDLHGGEPLLIDPEMMIYFFEEANNTLLPDITPSFKIQTNATLINNDWCEIFAKYKVAVGVSLDGPKEINDIHRIDHKGMGTFEDTIRGIRHLMSHTAYREAGLKPSILSVVNPGYDFREMYDLIKELGLERLNLLLPDYHHDNFPKEMESQFADYLINAFDLWVADSGSNRIKISIFEDLIRLILGDTHTSEYWGEGLLPMMVMETNGDYEAGDALKICGDSFTKTQYNVLDNPIEDALNDKLISDYVHSKVNLPDKCQNCYLKEICGGGFYPHRYSGKNGFNNESVYCQVISSLIVHIQNIIVDVFPEEIIHENGIMKLNLLEVRKSQALV